MTEPTDLTDYRNKRAAPDPEFVMTDDFGRPMFAYLLSYDFNGGSWNIKLWAYSMEDAEARIQAMRESLTLDGQMFTTVPA
jgi:hypothetical protein